jgi:hypothetical protein
MSEGSPAASRAYVTWFDVLHMLEVYLHRYQHSSGSQRARLQAFCLYGPMQPMICCHPTSQRIKHASCVICILKACSARSRTQELDPGSLLAPGNTAGLQSVSAHARLASLATSSHGYGPDMRSTA